MDFSVITMGKVDEKFARLEHCCFGLFDKPVFPIEAALFVSGLRKNNFKVNFFDGNFTKEEEVLKELTNNKPEKIIYYLYTPFIRNKVDFLRKLSLISKLYLVIAPYFWRDKILQEFSFIEDVFYDGEKGFNVDVSELEINYNHFSINKYLDLNKESFLLIASKYCPYSCTFCNAQRTGLLERNLEFIKTEAVILKNKGVKKINICGNNLTINKNWFLGLCKIMKDLDISWFGDARINHMTEEMYKAVKDSNGELLYGVESADEKILKKMNKNLTIDQVLENSKIHKKLKIPFYYTFMFGFPNDSKESFQKILKLRKKINAVNYDCAFPIAYPGYPLFEEVEKCNLLNEKSLDFQDFSWEKSPLSGTLFLSKDDLIKCNRKLKLSMLFKRDVVFYFLKKQKLKNC